MERSLMKPSRKMSWLWLKSPGNMASTNSA
jgi:hypothetical protein